MSMKPHKFENETSSSDDDEYAEFLTEEVEEGFFKVLSRLKKKDSKLYDAAVRYYPTDGSEPGASGEKDNKLAKQEYKKWLKGEIKKVDDVALKEDLEALHNFWVDPQISKEDQFLRDYILNKKFLEPDEKFDVEKEIEKLSEEEKEIEEQATFEEKYNCRFENPDKEFLEKYPGTIVQNNEVEKVPNDVRKKKKRKRKQLNTNRNEEKDFNTLEKPKLNSGQQIKLTKFKNKIEANVDDTEYGQNNGVLNDKLNVKHKKEQILSGTPEEGNIEIRNKRRRKSRHRALKKPKLMSTETE